jgi:hypothetical protein
MLDLQHQYNNCTDGQVARGRTPAQRAGPNDWTRVRSTRVQSKTCYYNTSSIGDVYLKYTSPIVLYIQYIKYIIIIYKLLFILMYV